MERKTNETFQKEFDVVKWLDSEREGFDTCGQYTFCGCCDKKNATPCATAYNKAKKLSPIADEVVFARTENALSLMGK